MTLLGVALATSNLVLPQRGRKHADKLNPSSIVLDGYTVVAKCLTLLNYDAWTRFVLERDATTVVTFRHLVPSGPCTVCNRVTGISMRRIVVFCDMWFGVDWCSVQIVVNSLQLTATSLYQERPPKVVHESCNILDQN